jgi:alpha-galactosidase
MHHGQKKMQVLERLRWNHRWINLLFVAGAMLVPAAAAEPATVVLTPRPGLSPRINGPKVYGARPGHPFLYRVPCTGLRPVRFAAEGLPRSLALAEDTGIISGSAPEQRGEYPIVLQATNAKGNSTRRFKLVVGDTLALTPPMGWNDWYAHYDRITEKLIREAAVAMVASGMADFGYAYVNIDGCWTMKPGSTDPALRDAPRDASGTLHPNLRFTDMKALTDFIHAKGLKAGIYSSPGPVDCAGYATSWQHEDADARTIARWGFDFLKYDWCSYGKVAPHATLEDYQRPYRLMGDILRKQDRDIVFNLCQYGMADVWKWGGKVGGNCWRTTGDLGMEKDTQLPGFYNIAFKNAEHFEYAQPGQWNDPDYILIGRVGDASKMGGPRPTRLTADEQYSYVSLWALMASPFIYSGAMDHLDEFTLNLLCNTEVIEVDQDPLGKQARVIRKTPDEFVLAKLMEDGSMALGLFNIGDKPRTITVDWSDLGLKGKRHVRDLWRQKSQPVAFERYSAAVSRHGVALVQLSSTRKP